MRYPPICTDIGATPIMTLGAQIWAICALTRLAAAKMQQKVCGRLTGENVTQHTLDIRGYVDTARAYVILAMTALRGHPGRQVLAVILARNAVLGRVPSDPLHSAGKR
jgi:hypothetical protein